MGRVRAEKFLEKNTDLAAVLVLASGDIVLVTPAARVFFELTDRKFTVEVIGGGTR